ncbi:transporter substrate-binding domain-containing protein, partial [Photobacterium sp. OFAV2-7]|uniref:transporter substrate-binding domain-containing protein n=1 Tax=Photobacterium sp. OFAV2-7 TaxID=2917748 RepID=UPI001EF6DC46
MVTKNRAIVPILLFLTCNSSLSLAKEQTIRVAGDPYPPWTEGKQGAEATGGIAVAIVNELFERLNKHTLVNVYPFQRGLERIRHGEEDVILMVSRSQEREQYMLFTDSIRYTSHGFFYSAELNNFDWSDW